MRIFGRLVYARDGWPLETVIGKPYQAAVRFLLLADLWRTFVKCHGPPHTSRQELHEEIDRAFPKYGEFEWFVQRNVRDCPGCGERGGCHAEGCGDDEGSYACEDSPVDTTRYQEE